MPTPRAKTASIGAITCPADWFGILHQEQPKKAQYRVVCGVSRAPSAPPPAAPPTPSSISTTLPSIGGGHPPVSLPRRVRASTGGCHPPISLCADTRFPGTLRCPANPRPRCSPPSLDPSTCQSRMYRLRTPVAVMVAGLWPCLLFWLLAVGCGLWACAAPLLPVPQQLLAGAAAARPACVLCYRRSAARVLLLAPARRAAAAMLSMHLLSRGYR